MSWQLYSEIQCIQYLFISKYNAFYGNTIYFSTENILCKVHIFQPLAMLLYVFGQYLLYLFVILEEKKRKRYHIINKANSAA